MTIDELVAHYGSQKKAAEALGLTEQAVSIWRRLGAIPFGRQCQIELETQGALKASRDEKDGQRVTG